MSDHTETATTRLRWHLMLWNRWTKPRREDLADGTTVLFFGFGRIDWRREQSGSGEADRG